VKAMPTEILDIDYTPYVSLTGTAHFTRRSLIEAFKTVEETEPKNVAVELDLRRFMSLNEQSIVGHGFQRCEFIGAAEALGNVDANIWLIDMPEKEIRARISQLMTPAEAFRRPVLYDEYGGIDEVRLWEAGYKEMVIERCMKRLEALRTTKPSVWQVLIEDRNTLMAARLAWITSKMMDSKDDPRILAFVGAAHVAGIERLLQNPDLIRRNLVRYDVTFHPPTLIRRVGVVAA